MRPMVTRREKEEGWLDTLAYVSAVPIVYYFAVEVLATPVLGNPVGFLRFLAIGAFAMGIVHLSLPRLKAEPRAPLLAGLVGVWTIYAAVIVAALGWHLIELWGQLAGLGAVIDALVGWRPPLSDQAGWILIGPLVAAGILTRYLVKASSNREALRDAIVLGGLGIVGPIILFGAWILFRSHFSLPSELGILSFTEFKRLAQALAAGSAIGAGLSWLYVVFDQLRDVFTNRGVPA